MDIKNALDKKEELCQLLKDFPYEIHRKDNAEYRYLEEDGICITAKNADKSKVLYLDLDEEFTLTFGSFHSHYDCSQNGYDELVDDLIGILENKIGVALIYHHYKEKLNWLGSRMICIEEVENSTIKQIFHYVFQTRDFRNNLDQYGGEVLYEFWDSCYDKRVMIDKKM